MEYFGWTGKSTRKIHVFLETCNQQCVVYFLKKAVTAVDVLYRPTRPHADFFSAGMFSMFCVCGIKAETRNVCTCYSASYNAIVTVCVNPRTLAVWLHATVKIRVVRKMSRCRAVPAKRKVLCVTQCLVLMVDVDLGREP